MKRFNLKYLFLLSLAALFIGCSDSSDVKEGMKKVHWDRDMCERCKMVVSERHFGVQMINPSSNRSFMFDDIGCAVLWFQEENKDWFDKAVIWINDAKSGEWIDARTASYTLGTLTPMGYGLSAFAQENLPQGATALKFEEAVTIIKDIDVEQKRRRIEKKKARDAARAALKNKEQ